MLLEASALGVPIAAMNTGGTPDIVKHGETGLLSSTPEALADDVRRLAEDEPLRRQLGAAAAPARRAYLRHPRRRAGTIEALYLDLNADSRFRSSEISRPDVNRMNRNPSRDPRNPRPVRSVNP